MHTCDCGIADSLTGKDAYKYAKQHLQRIADRCGWTQLWACRTCSAYWEATWEGGGGFDSGVLMLRKLTLEQVKDKWPEAA